MWLNINKLEDKNDIYFQHISFLGIQISKPRFAKHLASLIDTLFWLLINFDLHSGMNLTTGHD